MALVDSRLGPGTLTLGANEFGAQVTNVRLVPTVDEVDGTPTLADPTPDPETQAAKWALEGTVIQDWEDATGFVDYCRENSGTSVAFTWVPNTGLAMDPTFAGTCIVKAIEFGGDVSVQITSDFSFRVVGQPTRTN